MNEPIPVSLARRAVERAIRECDAATPGPWAQDDDAFVFSRVIKKRNQSGGWNSYIVYQTDQREANAGADCDFATLARAGFRASLQFLLFDIENSGCLSDVSLRAVAPLVAHYDAVHPGWRTE